ncbi:preprotein translocase subunit SecE [Asticcacaulis sp. 201]|uniref:preprotein translocase subunit SecE n=1 Tax=Asticcacaulis sp. 201 TaxID=3028787 RepID=UPI0029170AD3|nr:preprotein translocase subunit SecE [Asticcacaulis sp. 201]MDV6329212.1 preprotein translocase subunit SecE [Asticcacaulis sp. 201]
MKKPETQKAGTKTKTVEPGRKVAIGKVDPVKAPAGAAAVEKTPKKPFNPVKFFKEVQVEAKRITWTTRKEVWITTVMVLIMVVLAGVFFFVIDGALGFLTNYVTKIGIQG